MPRLAVPAQSAAKPSLAVLRLLAEDVAAGDARALRQWGRVSAAYRVGEDRPADGLPSQDGYSATDDNQGFFLLRLMKKRNIDSFLADKGFASQKGCFHWALFRPTEDNNS